MPNRRRSWSTWWRECCPEWSGFPASSGAIPCACAGRPGTPPASSSRRGWTTRCRRPSSTPHVRTYVALGLIPDTLELRPLLLDLYTEQVMGYYDPRSTTLYVLREADLGHCGLS
jgi:hypothetical protein